METEKSDLEARILELEDQLASASSWETTTVPEPSQPSEESTLLRQQIDFQNQEISRLQSLASESEEKARYSQSLEEEITKLRGQIAKQVQEIERLRSSEIENAAREGQEHGEIEALKVRIKDVIWMQTRGGMVRGLGQKCNFEAKKCGGRPKMRFLGQKITIFRSKMRFLV